MRTPLERMYPKRCYDCLAVLNEREDFLCGKCQAVYDSVK